MSRPDRFTSDDLKIAVERALQTLSVRRAEIPGTVQWESLRCVGVERAFGAWWQAVLSEAGAENPHLRHALRDLLRARGYGDVEVVTEQDLCSPRPRGEDAAHPDDRAVDRFAVALKAKLAAARAKGRAGWESCDPAALRAGLRDHLAKGDPRDVAAYALFLWARGESTAEPVVFSEDIVRDTTTKALLLLRARHYERPIDGAINWSNIQCVAAEPSRAGWRVTVARADPVNPALHQALIDQMQTWGYADIEVVTEW